MKTPVVLILPAKNNKSSILFLHMTLFGYSETITVQFAEQSLRPAPDVLTVWSANTGNLRGRKEGVASFFERLSKKEGERNLERMVEQIIDENPDIVLLQENDGESWRTNGIEQAETIAKKTGYDVMITPAHMIPGFLVMGNAILAKYPLHPIGRWDYSTWGIRIIHEYQDLMGAALCFEEGEVAVYNTHFLAWEIVYGFGSGWFRQQEAKVVASVLAQEDRLFIFGGDLNEEYSLSRPQSAMGILRASHLFWDEGFERNMAAGATWPNVENYQSRKERLDYILPGKDLYLEDLRTIDNDVSDHLFVEGRVAGIRAALAAQAQQRKETSSYRNGAHR